MELKEINIKFIPQESQRYPTCGDYGIDENGAMWINITAMDKEIHSMAVLVHELVEYALLRHKGTVTTEMVDEFDLEFEERRKRGEVDEFDEPGFAEDSPYREEHLAATVAEMTVIAGAGESWGVYEKEINNLFE